MATNESAVATGIRSDGNRFDVQEVTQNNAVEVRLRFDANFSEVASDLDGFGQRLQRSLAQAAGIEQNRVVVFSIAPGSIIVNFYIFEATSQSSPSAAVAAVTLQGKIAGIYWDAPLAPLMRTASIISKAPRRVPMAKMAGHNSKTTEMLLQPLSGFVPPRGCFCVSGEAISAGCADHRGLGPAWCRVAQPCKSSFLSTSRGHWVFCLAAQDGRDWLHALQGPSELSAAHQSHRACLRLVLLMAIIINIFRSHGCAG